MGPYAGADYNQTISYCRLRSLERLYSKTNVGVWDPMLELTITKPYLIVDSEVYKGCIQRQTWGMGPYAGADYNQTIFYCRLRSLQRLYSKTNVGYGTLCWS
jgi:hypothetical protein